METLIAPRFFAQKPRIIWSCYDGCWSCFTGPSEGRVEGSQGWGATPHQAYMEWWSEEEEAAVAAGIK